MMREELMEDDKLRSHFRKRFYDSRVDLNNLEWQDIEKQLKPAPFTYLLVAKKYKWMSIAASVLFIVTLFAYNIYDGENEGMYADLQVVPENSDTPEPQISNEGNIETIPSSQEINTNDSDSDNLLISERTQSNESRNNKENVSQDNLAITQSGDLASFVGIQDVTFNNLNRTKTETPNFKAPVIDGYVSVDITLDNHSFNSESNEFLAVKNENAFLTMNRISFSIGPVQKYFTFNPNLKDLIYIPGLNSLSPVSENRLGIHASFSSQFRINTKWNLVIGASYLNQKNYFEYESINLLNSQSNQTIINASSSHAGLSAGIERTAPFLTSFQPALHFNVEYLKGMDSGENLLGDIFSVDFGFSATLMEANRVEFRIKPVISYSFLEAKNTQFSSKPYWVGIQFTVDRKFN